MSDITNVSVSTPAPAPSAPVAPTPAPAPAPAPTPAPMRGINPVINLSGQQVNALGEPIPDNHISFEEIDAAPKKSARTKTPATPSAPAKPDASGAAPKAQPEASSATEEASVFGEPTSLEARSGSESPSAPKEPGASDAAGSANDKQSNARNYSELPPEVVAIAKKLPNTVYTHLVDTYKKWNEEIAAERAKVAEATTKLESAASKFTVETPEAFRIDPEYNNVVTQYGQVEQELSHYTDQLARISAGESWSVIEGYDASGQPVYKEIPAPADGRVDYRMQAQVQRALQTLSTKQTQLQGEASRIQTYYKNAAAETQAHYQEAQTRLFKDLTPDKLTDPAEKELFGLALKALPKVEQSRPSAKFLGLAAVLVRRGAIREKALLERAERAERLLKTSRTADPVRPTSAGTSVDAASTHISFDDL